jgi:hypothetical protein
MHGHPYYYSPTYLPNNYGYETYVNYPPQRVFPSIDTKIFSSSVHSFRFLMEQGSILLDKLADSSFEKKIMNAAQQGKQSYVDHLIKSIGLKVPVTTQYSPSGVQFILHSQTNCCSLTFSMKWGN